MNLWMVSKNHHEIANGWKRRYFSHFQQFLKNTKYQPNLLKSIPWIKIALIYTLELYCKNRLENESGNGV